MTVSCSAAGIAQHCCGGRARAQAVRHASVVDPVQPLTDKQVHCYYTSSMLRLHLNVLGLAVIFFFLMYGGAGPRTRRNNAASFPQKWTMQLATASCSAGSHHKTQPTGYRSCSQRENSRISNGLAGLEQKVEPNKKAACITITY